MRFLQEAFSAGSETAQPFLPYGAENAKFWSQIFRNENDHFTKTGSGQTRRNG